MSRTILPDPDYPDCPIRNILSRTGDKWSALTLYTLQHGSVMRFGELQRAIPDISQKSLTATLRTQEEGGLIIVKPTQKYRSAWSIRSLRAQSLMVHIDLIIQWAAENMDDVLSDRKSRLRPA